MAGIPSGGHRLAAMSATYLNACLRNRGVRALILEARGLLAIQAPRPVLVRLGVLLLLVFAHAAVGTVQFFTGVPAALVAVHVAGAAACTAATAALWASMRERAKPQPIQS